MPKGWKLLKIQEITCRLLVQFQFIRQEFTKVGTYYLVWDNSGGTKSFTILEQNFDRKANSPAKLREDDYMA